MERPRSAPAARRVAPIPNKRPGSAHAWTEAKRRDAKREELLALIEGCGVEPVLDAASQKVLKTDPTRAKAALKKLDFAAHAARCGLQKGQPAAAQAALKTIEAKATGLHRTVTAMADERDHFKYVSEELERRLLGNMKSKQSQIEALSMRVKHDRDALLSTLNSLRERNELLEEQVESCVEIKFLRYAPSTRRLLDGVAMPNHHRSTEPARLRHRREMTAPDTLVDLCTGRAPGNRPRGHSGETQREGPTPLL
jgi:hypothetical protein